MGLPRLRKFHLFAIAACVPCCLPLIVPLAVILGGGASAWVAGATWLAVGLLGVGMVFAAGTWARRRSRSRRPHRPVPLPLFEEWRKS